MSDDEPKIVSKPGRKKSAKKATKKITKKVVKAVTASEPEESDVKGRPSLADSLSVASAILSKTGKGGLRATSELLEFQKKLMFTGLLELDLNLKPGFQSVYQILGDPSAGKTLLSLILTGAAQRTCRDCYTPIIPFINDFTGETITKCMCGNNNGMTVAFFDLENSFDPSWAETWGVNTGGYSKDSDNATFDEPIKGVKVAPDAKFAVIRMTTIDQMIVIAQELLGTGAVDFAVVDSLAAPLTQEMTDGKDQPGTRARAVGKLMTAINSSMSRCWIDHKIAPTVVLLNQYRMRIGGISPMQDPRTSAGGEALKYTAMQSIHLHGKYFGEDGTYKGVRHFGDFSLKAKKDKFGDSAGGEANYRLYLKNTMKSRINYQAGESDEGGRLWNFIREMGETYSDPRWYSKDSKGITVLGRRFTAAKDVQVFLSRPDIGYLMRLPLFSLKFSAQMRRHLSTSMYAYTPFTDDPIMELINEATQRIGQNAIEGSREYEPIMSSSTRTGRVSAASPNISQKPSSRAEDAQEQA